jgi:hypothetical protein
MRLNNYVSESGACSHREADALMAEGRVTVNGLPAPRGYASVMVGFYDRSRKSTMPMPMPMPMLANALLGLHDQGRLSADHRKQEAEGGIHQGEPRR